MDDLVSVAAHDMERDDAGVIFTCIRAGGVWMFSMVDARAKPEFVQ